MERPKGLIPKEVCEMALREKWIALALVIALIGLPLGALFKDADAADPRETELTVEVDLPIYCTKATIDEKTYDVHVGTGDAQVKINDVTYTIDGTNLKLESVKKGELSGARQEVKTEGKVPIKVTLEGTTEPVNSATVRWAELKDETNPFGEVTLKAPFITSSKDYGQVEAVKVYKQESIQRSAYGKSKYPIVVVPYDLSIAEEFVSWSKHYALTKEAQAMYEVAEVLGDWQNWKAIFGSKGGNLATFIKGFPQFMVNRGAAMEATRNMLDTIWALFALMPAIVLALPSLLETAPMRMLQFWPAFVINLPIFLDGISNMVIDLGVFMTSLAPSVLILLPELFESLPNIVPNSVDTVMTSVELFFDIIPPLSKYLPAALAAIPASLIQLLQAFYYSATDIFIVAWDETLATIENLFRSWPLFPAGMAAGVLAVAPALMMLPTLAPVVLIGKTAENTAAALGDWRQTFLEMPSRLLDSVVKAMGTNPATMVGRYLLVLAYVATSVIWLLPSIVVASWALIIGLFPIELLAFVLIAAPAFAFLSFIPFIGIPIALGLMVAVAISVCTLLGPLILATIIVGPPGLILGLFTGWTEQLIWAGWMAASVFASFAAMVPGAIFDLLKATARSALWIFTLPGYAIGWFFAGILDVLEEVIPPFIENIIASLLGSLEVELGSILPDLVEGLGAMLPVLVEQLGSLPPEVVEQLKNIPALLSMAVNVIVNLLGLMPLT